MNTKVRNIVYCALLAALGAIFSAFFSIEIPVGATKLVEISLTPVFVMIAGILFGPLLGAAVGFVADTTGFFMGVQHGAYNPIFSISMALFGLIAGLIFLKNNKSEWVKVLIAIVVAQIVCSMLINTYAIHFFYGVPFKVLFAPRIISALIEMPIYYVVMMALLKAIRPLINRN